MDKYFTITTNRQVADQIEKQCAFDEKYKCRSYKLGGISHHAGFSDVRIIPKDDKIQAEDIFWLGHYSALLGK